MNTHSYGLLSVLHTVKSKIVYLPCPGLVNAPVSFFKFNLENIFC